MAKYYEITTEIFKFLGVTAVPAYLIVSLQVAQTISDIVQIGQDKGIVNIRDIGATCT